MAKEQLPHSDRWTWQVGLLAIACISLLSTHTQSSEQTFGRYLAKDSGMRARAASPEDLNWIDNERIIFIGSKPGETRSESGRQLPRDDLYVWNTTTGDIRREAELSFRSGLCVAPDYIRYRFQRDGISYVGFGKPGLTHVAELDVQAHKDGILAVSPVSCREYNPKLLRKRYGNWALPLLEPGEYLDRTSRDSVSLLRYFPADGSDAIAISEIPNRDAITIPRYSRYADKYVFAEIRRSGGPEFTQRVWLLDRRGQVTENVLPAGPWMKALSVTAMPARSGWAMTSRAAGPGKALGSAGIYVVRQEKVSRVMTAFPYASAVSPDGCKIAAAIEVNKRADAAIPRIWMIDLCQGGK